MYIEGIFLGLAIIFEGILIGKIIVKYKRLEKFEAEKRKNWNNAWV